MRRPTLFVAMLAAAPAAAEPPEVRPLLDARLRYEAVAQDGLPRDADAVTFRGRAGVQVTSGDWSLLAEAEGTAALVERYDSGLNGMTAHPVVGEPENIELNRLQLQYRGLPATVATVGRQRVNLEDQRFVGAVGWRQNEQTFDAIRLQWAGTKGLRADVTYSWSTRTIWGVDGVGARQQAIEGNNVFALLSWETPAGSLTGFAYLVDQDELPVQAFRLSNQTYGLRLAGSRLLGNAVTLSYAGSYARQFDWHRNPNDFAADYWLTELGLEFAGAKLGAGHEVLGADDGRPLTSVQTPLATLHKFQGWADKFLTTPPDGIQDTYASIGYGWKQLAGLQAVNLQAIYHRFDSDRLGLHYGDEIDLAASAKIDRFTVVAKYARYRADDFATDTDKFWLQLECAF